MAAPSGTVGIIGQRRGAAIGCSACFGLARSIHSVTHYVVESWLRSSQEWNQCPDTDDDLLKWSWRFWCFRVTPSRTGPLVVGGRRCGDGLDASQVIEINTIPTARSARSRRFILSFAQGCQSLRVRAACEPLSRGRTPETERCGRPSASEPATELARPHSLQ